MKHALEVTDLHKHYGRVRAVDGMSLAVPRGSAFGLIGLNGAGKTTLIKMLLGITHASSGRIQVLEGLPSQVAVRRRLGYLPERLLLPPALTAVGFLRSVGRIKGLGGAELASETRRCLEAVELDPKFWNERSATFSKGMLQRTGLAAALLGEPDLLLLDEPTDGIDPLGRAHIRTILREALGRGVTLFINSHLLSETEKLCDHVAVAQRGRIVRSGPIDELRAQNRFRVRFVESSNTDAIATSLGLAVDEQARAQGLGGSFVFAGSDVANLSAALQQALQRGLILLEMHPLLRDLEDVLAESLDAGSDTVEAPT